MAIWLCERLTFDKLFRISDPKRVYRSFTVRGPPLEIDSYQDTVYYSFNFKANPSTTGLRHRGYIKFFKPLRKSPKDVPLQHLDCVVDCECPDFRYRWAWANKQRGSSRVGPDSLNQAWNKAPRKTNPTGRPGLCKHILAARQYIYGLLSSFPGDEPDTAEKLSKLTKHAQKRWTDYEGAMQAAKEREQLLLQRRAQKNVGAIKPKPMVPITPVRPKAPATKPAPGEEPEELQATTPAPTIKPEPLPAPEPKKSTPPLAVPPGQRGRGFPSLSTKPEGKPKRVIGNRVVKGMIPGQVPGTWESLQNPIWESVVKTTGEKIDMSTLKDAIKLVEEMEADELELHREPEGDEFGGGGGAGARGAGGMGSFGADDAGGAGGAGGLDDMGTMDAPMEPPMSDSAVGADTEGETALGLLRTMKDLLLQIATAVAPEQMPGAEGEMGAEGGMPGGAPGGMPEEPPTEMPGGEGEAEGGEFEPEGEGAPEGEGEADPEPEAEEEEGQTRPAPKKKAPKGDEE